MTQSVGSLTRRGGYREILHSLRLAESVYERDRQWKILFKIYTDLLSFFFLQILLQPVDNIADVAPCLQNFLRRYNDEFSGEGLDLSISSHVMFHVVRLHRILSYKNR